MSRELTQAASRGGAELDIVSGFEEEATRLEAIDNPSDDQQARLTLLKICVLASREGLPEVFHRVLEAAADVMGKLLTTQPSRGDHLVRAGRQEPPMQNQRCCVSACLELSATSARRMLTEPCILRRHNCCADADPKTPGMPPVNWEEPAFKEVTGEASLGLRPGPQRPRPGLAGLAGRLSQAGWLCRRAQPGWDGLACYRLAGPSALADVMLAGSGLNRLHCSSSVTLQEKVSLAVPKGHRTIQEAKALVEMHSAAVRMEREKADLQRRAQWPVSARRHTLRTCTPWPRPLPAPATS